MKKNHRFWLLALVLSLLLTCAACGKKTVSYAPGNIPTATQEQTTDTRKDDTAETGTTKADGKQDAAKTEDKTADDKKPDKQKPAGEAKKTEEDTKSRRKPSAWRSRSGWKKRRNSRNRSSLLRRTRTPRLHLTLRRRHPYRCTFPVPRCLIIWTSAPTA